MKKLTTFASAAILAAVAGQAGAATYTIAGTNSGGVNLAYNQTPGPGACLPGSGVTTATWDCTGSGAPVYTGTQEDAMVSFAGATVVVYILGGSYDDVTGDGSWDISIDITGFGSGQQALLITGQTFNLDSTTGTGTLNPDGACTGDFGGCLGLGSSFAGSFQASTTPIGAGSNIFNLLGSQAGDVPFAVTLTPTSPIPVPAAAWLFGSALLGLAGVGRKRKAA